MKSPKGSFLKMTLYAFLISILIVIPVFASWASTITTEDAKLWKMWINLAINGYADPLPMNKPGERHWWKFWE